MYKRPLYKVTLEDSTEEHIGSRARNHEPYRAVPR